MSSEMSAKASSKILIDKSLCCGYGVCKEVCPQIFELGEGGLVDLLTDTVPAGLETEAQDAADACPQAVITFQDT